MEEISEGFVFDGGVSIMTWHTLGTVPYKPEEVLNGVYINVTHWELNLSSWRPNFFHTPLAGVHIYRFITQMLHVWNIGLHQKNTWPHSRGNGIVLFKPSMQPSFLDQGWDGKFRPSHFNLKNCKYKKGELPNAIAEIWDVKIQPKLRPPVIPDDPSEGTDEASDTTDTVLPKSRRLWRLTMSFARLKSSLSPKKMANITLKICSLALGMKTRTVPSRFPWRRPSESTCFVWLSLLLRHWMSWSKASPSTSIWWDNLDCWLLQTLRWQRSFDRWHSHHQGHRHNWPSRGWVEPWDFHSWWWQESHQTYFEDKGNRDNNLEWQGHLRAVVLEGCWDSGQVFLTWSICVSHPTFQVPKLAFVRENQRPR